ncbi:putative Citrate synthase, glyoxysomal [Cocos nucifera]|uniref:Citrate synthase n=2 Tax=Magnoliopsida TaxID=3398 RepID=A0A8K0I9Z3_COCNU|nr:putative Citrate synthase, glyoxysomal [Cocos nucifera]
MERSFDSATLARSRLAVLSAHLAAAANLPPILETSPVSAQEIVRPPGNFGGFLTVVDGRTGKKFELQISEEGTVKATDLKKITTGKQDKGLKLYDPGYLNTAPVRSSICYIDGDEGILRYRGYPIEELAESSTFVEVAYLLMYANLPSKSQLANWEFAISQHSAVPQGLLDIIQSMPHDAHPMGVLVSAMSALSVFHPDANPALRGQSLYQSKQVRDKQIVRILGKAPAIAAAAYLRLAGRPPVLPSNNLSYSENFLYMLDSLGNRSYKPNPRLARALDILFILHAEHEMNCSTAAARHLASSGVDVYTAIAGAVGALYGPLHGGANEAVLKMLNEIGTVENIPEFIEGVKNRKRKMSGFGHRVYKNYDPRAKVIRKLAEEVFSIVGRDPLIEVAVALEKAALSDEYFVKRRLYPNVDFYSGLIYRAMGFPTEFFPVLFAIPRMAGYLAHWRESLDDPDTKIMRPQQEVSMSTFLIAMSCPFHPQIFIPLPSCSELPRPLFISLPNLFPGLAFRSFISKKTMERSFDSATLARSRLAVLSAHLAAAANLPPILETSPVSAQEIVRPPGNFGGFLTVVDGRTGKKFELQISEEGTVKATDLKKITTGKQDKGLKLYDPGYLNTAPVRSSICYIDGDEGILRYRGYPIEELAESSTFVEVAYLLMYANLPSKSQLANWEFAISQHSAVPQGLLDIIQSMPHDAHPMGVLVSAMSALSVFHPDANPALRGQSLYQSKQVRDKQIVRILGKAPAIAAAAYLRLAGRPPVLPSNNLSYSENFLYMLDSLGNRSYKPNPRLARALDILFILHAEHEMNCSTAAARHLASSGVDVYTAIAGAVGALYGPLHGGANEAVLKMLNEIGTVENIPEFIEGVKNRKRKMSGFGHRVYKNYDPRAKVIRKLAEEVFSIVGRDPLIEVAVALEKAALSDEYFVKRRLYPNVDFYSGLIYRAMGFPTEFFPVLFAIPRMAGYLAHWRESLDDPDTKIMRPQQVYTGAWLRHYISLKERTLSAEADKLGQLAISNATRRRLSGSRV